ncbi:MAG: hypothetical protein ACRD00_07630 [Thermoanaerobaculia bacterium]
MTWALPAVAVAIGLALSGAPEPTPTPTPSPVAPATRRAGPTFCAEWVRQTTEGYERLTLFADRTLVWKTSRGAEEQVRRKTMSADETDFFCQYFARDEFFALPGDLRSGMTGDAVAQSRVSLTRPDGSRKAIRFDEFSSFSAESISLKASLLGLRNLFTERLAPATSFTPETLKPGTVLRRFDGIVFRVRRVIADKELVELEGVKDPIFLYLALSQMRYQFAPPE